jgi:hypothetical protein
MINARSRHQGKKNPIPTTERRKALVRFPAGTQNSARWNRRMGGAMALMNAIAPGNAKRC